MNILIRLNISRARLSASSGPLLFELWHRVMPLIITTGPRAPFDMRCHLSVFLQRENARCLAWCCEDAHIFSAQRETDRFFETAFALVF